MGWFFSVLLCPKGNFSIFSVIQAVPAMSAKTRPVATATHIGYDAVKHLVLCRVEQRPPRLDLDVYPYLPRARVTTTVAASYMSLLVGGAP